MLVRTVYITHSFLPKHFYLKMVLFSFFSLFKSSVFNLRICSFRKTLGCFNRLEIYSGIHVGFG